MATEMKSLNTDAMLKSMSYIGAALSEWRMLQQLEGHIVPATISFDVRVGFLKSIDMLKDSAVELGMGTTISVINNGFDDALNQIAPNRPLNAQELQRLIVFADKVVSVFIAEASSHSFVAIATGHSAYFAPDLPLFGESVEDAFPTSIQEIADAGRCRAAGLWTGCVMHLMRAIEPALGSLANSVGVDADQNWNTTLNQIESKLREFRKSDRGADAEKWASEVVLELRAVKNAWRNHAMHSRSRYNEGEAVAIFDTVKRLMGNLATRLSE
jgi:hypothetical protein